MTCPARMVKERDLEQIRDLELIIEEIELAGIELQYIAASVDCEGTNASSAGRARLKYTLLRAGACALEVAAEVLGKVAERENSQATDWP